MRIAVLVKQIPAFEDMRLVDGRLERIGVPLEMNPFCRRAVAKGVELGATTVITLGPPSAEEVLKEAITWGAKEGVLVTDPAFAGSDTLATARALAAAISLTGPYDLIIVGLNSVDADTGQVGPQIAELLGLPFLGGVREMELERVSETVSETYSGVTGEISARCERDDGFLRARTRLPAVISAAERLCDPCKVPARERDDCSGRIRRITAADLGEGPWGQEGSPTRVGDIRMLSVPRRGLLLSGPVREQVRTACDLLRESRLADGTVAPVVPAERETGSGAVVAVLGEPGRARITRELLGGAAGLAAKLGGSTALFTTEPAGEQGEWWADAVVGLDRIDSPWAFSEVMGTTSAMADMTPEDVAEGAAAWASEAAPWAILVPGTSWGRETAGRLAVRLGAGLTGDAVELEVADGRLVCWKAAFGGQLVAAVTSRSGIQMATVRSGVFPVPELRAGAVAPVTKVPIRSRNRVEVTGWVTDDDPSRLETARVVVGVGLGVDPTRYNELEPLLGPLGAELAGTRKVTDRGWLPRSRQVGITGRSIAPEVYVALGTSGRFNHMVAVRGARFVIAVNPDPRAEVFHAADVGIVADWAEAVPLLAEELGRSLRG
ncbi:MAG: electron transfer flavoprotein beta subunit [Sphaerisporangium sp.]|nr:electron transfer flavoprotein beta subunit [Sphaerisporangium sp.]